MINYIMITKEWEGVLYKELALLYKRQIVWYWFMIYMEWTKQNNLCRFFFSVVKQRLIDINIQSCQDQINNSLRCVIHKHVIDYFGLQYYLCKYIPPIYKRYIGQIRLSSHYLEIETIRQNNVLLIIRKS